MTADIANNVIKPCPFCGSEAILTEIEPHDHSPTLVALGLPGKHPGSFTIECVACECGMINGTREGVVSAWNRRVSPAGQWVHCSPALLSAGVSCADTPRRACACEPENGGHDHFIAHTAPYCSMIDIDELERLAKSANEFNPYWSDAGSWAADLGNWTEGEYIAALDPKSVLALIAEVRALRAYREMAQMQVYELMGVEADVEQGHGFDNTCLETIKRVMGELVAKEPK